MAQNRGGAGGELIRCPDWQRYAPQVVRASLGERQTRTAFAERTGAQTPTAADPATASRAGSCTHTIAQGDTLGSIAAAKLGSSTRWREIAAANPGQDPSRLRIGTTINLPCVNTTAGSTAAGGGPAPLAGTRWLSRVGGTEARRGTTASPVRPGNATSSDPAGISSASESAPVEPSLPVWSARQGEYLSDILERWGREAGWRVIVDTPDAWQLAVPLRFRASFEDAVGELVRGLAHGGTPPRVRLHPNKVLRLGGPL